MNVTRTGARSRYGVLMRYRTLCTVIVFVMMAAGCAVPPEEAGPARSSVAPLEGEAARLVAEAIARFDGDDGPSKLHGSPDVVYRPDLTKVAVDRTCLVGSELVDDNRWPEFVRELERAGAPLDVIVRDIDGVPAKVIVNLDGMHVALSPSRW